MLNPGRHRAHADTLDWPPRRVRERDRRDSHRGGQNGGVQAHPQHHVRPSERRRDRGGVGRDDSARPCSCVTIISGEATRPRYIARVRHRLTKLIPNATVVTIPDSGHALAFDNPSAGAAAIRAASVGALT
jgi:pimeloyl-ACP methyl ester carboxylesterase